MFFFFILLFFDFFVTTLLFIVFTFVLIPLVSGHQLYRSAINV